MKLFRKEEGFTLVELMVVVLIIGILVAIAIPMFNLARERSQERSCFANQRTIEGASSTYVADVVGNTLADLNEAPMTAANPLLADADGDGKGDFLANLPTCPQDDSEYDLAGGVVACNAAIPHAHYSTANAPAAP